MREDVLTFYINEVFNTCDFNRSGLLDQRQFYYFINQLMVRLGDARRFTEWEAYCIFQQTDTNRSGRIHILEALNICKSLFNVNPYTGDILVYLPPPPGYVYTYRVVRQVVRHQQPITVNQPYLVTKLHTVY